MSAQTAPAKSELVQWGADLFNHGYYWEAHEAWETLWHSINEDISLRRILKGLILLAATGIKVRGGNQMAASRHGQKAHSLFVGVDNEQGALFRSAVGLDIDQLAEWSLIAAKTELSVELIESSDPIAVFNFILNPSKS